MSVLVMGVRDVEEVELLTDAVERRGGEAVVCDLHAWPSGEEITYAPGEGRVTLGADIEFDEVSGAYVWAPRLFRPSNLRFNDALEEDLRPTLNQIREYRSVFESVCYRLERNGANVVPRIENHHWHDRKPWQLAFCDDEDVPVPDTLITNSPEEVRDFHDEHERVIYKPVTSGGTPKELTDDDLTESRLADLATAPVQFQEFAPGEDLRVYFLDGEVIGAIRYLSEGYSFKVDIAEGNRVEVERFEPSAEMEAAVERAAESSGLTFGGVDVRREPSGEFRVLEINDVPRFAAANLDTDQDIAGRLAEYLMDGGA